MIKVLAFPITPSINYLIFYSLPRPDSAKSTGLGLPFVKEVASLQGSITLENRYSANETSQNSAGRQAGYGFRFKPSFWYCYIGPLDRSGRPHSAHKASSIGDRTSQSSSKLHIALLTVQLP